MGRTRGLVVVALVIAAVASLVTVAAAQDRVKTKEIVVGLGAEARTMLGVMIVDWTTNNMLEHIYDRLLDRDSKTFKPKPMLATEWKIDDISAWNRHSGTSPTVRCRSSRSRNSRSRCTGFTACIADFMVRCT